MKCRATATGHDGIAQREPGDIFELSEEQAGFPPYPDEPHRFVWFDVIPEDPKPTEAAPAANATEDGKGLTFSAAEGQFHTDEGSKLAAYKDELPA